MTLRDLDIMMINLQNATHSLIQEVITSRTDLFETNCALRQQVKDLTMQNDTLVEYLLASHRHSNNQEIIAGNDNRLESIISFLEKLFKK